MLFEPNSISSNFQAFWKCQDFDILLSWLQEFLYKNNVANYISSVSTFLFDSIIINQCNGFFLAGLQFNCTRIGNIWPLPCRPMTLCGTPCVRLELSYYVLYFYLFMNFLYQNIYIVDLYVRPSKFDLDGEVIYG